MSGLTIMREPVTNGSFISAIEPNRMLQRATAQMAERMALDIEDMIINGLPDDVIEEVIEEYTKSFPTANSVRKIRFR